MRQLPSLNALKTFEACARHRSFTIAAEELLVTQSAVSRQVRGLEDYLGVRLFLRLPRQIELTQQGKSLLPLLTDILDRLSVATAELKRTNRSIRLKLPPTFAIRWLIPRLHQFQSKHDDLDVLLNAGWNPVDFLKEDFDVGIVCSSDLDRYDRTIMSELIAEERVTPVCSPELLEHSPPIQTPADISRLTMLHGSEIFDLWAAWFQAIGVSVPSGGKSQMYDLMDTAIHAAMRGIGVALATPQFIADDIELGRLVMLFPEFAPAISGFHLVRPERVAMHESDNKFRDWLIEEVKAEWDACCFFENGVVLTTPGRESLVSKGSGCRSESLFESP